MDGRVKFYLSRMMATNLTWTDPANILALLNHLKTLVRITDDVKVIAYQNI